MNRRSFLKKFFAGLLPLLGLSGSTYLYARHVEPDMLQINRRKIVVKNIAITFDHFKIVQFSVSHIGFHYSIDQLQKLVRTINCEQPNVVVFTGDLIDKPQSFTANSLLMNTLSHLKATHGKYWIYGNHDHGGYGTGAVKAIMEAANFTLLQNNHTLITQGNEQIAIAGIDDIILGKPNIEKALENIDPNMFTILLVHEPDFADIALAYPIDMHLSGHSHGGQVRFPVIGHLYTPNYAEKYIQGKYTFSNHHMSLYVNRGIGTTRLPFRFLCKPEISIFTLTNDASNS